MLKPTMQRPAPSSQPPDASGATGPEALPPLDVLLERARAMEAGRAEVDALLLGLSQPLGPGEDARARAKLLQRIIHDRRLASFTGSDGRRVDGAAAQALVTLGEPYASELSKAGQEAFLRAEAASSSFIIYDGDGELPPVVISPRQRVGQILLIGSWMLEVAILFQREPGLVRWLALAGVASFVPTIVALSERGIRNRLLHFTCLVLAALPSLPWLALAIVFFIFDGWRNNERTYAYLPQLAMALLHLSAPVCLYGRPRAARGVRGS
jgi:hypothetical protein